MNDLHIKAIQLKAFRETSCQSCSLRNFCLPVSLDLVEIERFDEIITRSRPIHAGEHLFRQGNTFSSLFAIRSGCIKTYCLSDHGDEQITGFGLPSELIGFSGIDSKIYPVSAVAIKTTSVCEIPYSKFDQLTDQMSSLKKQLIHSLSKEIRNDLRVKLLLGKKNAAERLSDFLLDIAARPKPAGYSCHYIVLPMSRDEIGNYLGLAAETVSRTLSRLQQDGLIKVDGRKIEILGIAALKAISGPCILSGQPYS